MSVPYAISRISSDLKWKSSCSIARKSRSASPSSSRRASARAASASTAAIGPLPPTIAQSSSSERSAGSSASRPRRDETVQRRRQLVQAVAVARLLHERDELLDEERVAAAAFEQEVDGLVVGVAAEQRAHELGGRVAVERIEVQRELVVLARRGRPAFVEAGPRGGDQHERPVVQPGEHAVAQSSASSLAQCRSESVSTSGPFAASASKNAMVERSASSRARVGSTPGRVDALDEVEQALDDALGLRRFGRQLEHGA